MGSNCIDMKGGFHTSALFLKKMKSKSPVPKHYDQNLKILSNNKNVFLCLKRFRNDFWFKWYQSIIWIHSLLHLNKISLLDKKAFWTKLNKNSHFKKMSGKNEIYTYLSKYAFKVSSIFLTLSYGSCVLRNSSAVVCRVSFTHLPSF